MDCWIPTNYPQICEKHEVLAYRTVFSNGNKYTAGGCNPLFSQYKSETECCSKYPSGCQHKMDEIANLECWDAVSNYPIVDCQMKTGIDCLQNATGFQHAHIDKQTCCNRMSPTQAEREKCMEGLEMSVPCWLPSTWWPERTCKQSFSETQCSVRWFQTDRKSVCRERVCA